MADGGDSADGVFTENFPAPPAFWRHFTKPNVERVAQLKENNEEIPTELSYLVPPPVPENEAYRSFGAHLRYEPYETPIASLESMSLERLYPKSLDTQETDDAGQPKNETDWTLDRGFYLKKIVRSILMNFLELVGQISQDPTATELKLKDIETLFLNAHHIVNEYRPHQARETLILMTEERIAKLKAEIQSVKDMKQKIDSLPASLPSFTEDIVMETNGAEPESEDSEHELVDATWASLGEELMT